MASAASDHAVSGTVIDPCAGGGWYESDNARTKSGTGAIKLEFSKINPGGIDWELLGKENQLIGSEQEWTKTETGVWRTFSSSVANGTTFYNTFEDGDQSDCDQGGYDFSGTESY